MLTLNDGRNELWQWDTGRKLTVDADCSQVHFSNKVFGRSIDVDVVDGTVAIPDVLLQVDNELIAWAFVGTPENGYTKISKVFKVNKRNKPANYVFTPTEQTTLGQIMERLDDLEAMQDPDAIKNVVDDYLANNPIKIDEKDPTVPAWAKNATKPSYSKSEVGLGNVDNVKQYSASNPPPYPVTSVNGKTGGVTLDASAVGALPASTTIPTKVSQLTNDKGYMTGYTETDPTVPSWAKAASKPSYSKSEVGLGNVDNVKQYSASNPPPYPVTSVNGKTGAVTVSVPTKVSQLQNDSGFLTEISKEEIIQQVIDTLGGAPISGVVDANKNIVLSGSLEDGTYTLKYKDAEGKTTEIGKLVLSNIVTVPVTFSKGKIDSSTGTISTGTKDYFYSTPVDVDAGYSYSLYVPAGLSVTCKVVFWDGSGAFLENNTINLWNDVTQTTTTKEANYSISIPSGAKSFRLRIYNFKYQNADVANSSLAAVQSGMVLTAARS